MAIDGGQEEEICERRQSRSRQEKEFGGGLNGPCLMTMNHQLMKPSSVHVSLWLCKLLSFFHSFKTPLIIKQKFFFFLRIKMI